jgi:hypothetical protein
VRESEFGEMEGTKESSFLSGIWKHSGRKAIIDSLADRAERYAELVQAQATRLRLCRAPKLLDETQREPKNWKGCIKSCCGSLLGGQGQDQISGLGRSRIHDLEDTALVRPSDREKTNARREYEAKTWSQKLIKEAYRNHRIECHMLCKEAQDRLAELGVDDVEQLVSYHLSARESVWGILNHNVLDLLWWDPDHLVYPAFKQHT